MSKQGKRRVIRYVGAASLATILIATGSLAYFSGTADVRNNAFSISEGEKNANDAATIYEDAWDALASVDLDKDGIPDQADELQPGDYFVKDPAIENNMNTPVYAFIRVTVPRATVHAPGKDVDSIEDLVQVANGKADTWDKTARKNTVVSTYTAGSKTTPGSTDYAAETRTWAADPTGSTTFAPNNTISANIDSTKWKLMSATTDDTQSVYIFGHIEPLATADGVKDSGPDRSENLFETLQVPNFNKITGNAVDGTLFDKDGTTHTLTNVISISGAVIQSDGYKDVTDAFNALNSDGAFSSLVSSLRQQFVKNGSGKEYQTTTVPGSTTTQKEDGNKQDVHSVHESK